MNATSTSDDAVRRLRGLREVLERGHGLGVVPVRIVGRRWSAVREAGRSASLPPAQARRMDLGGGWGLVVYGWDALAEPARVAVLDACRAAGFAGVSAAPVD